jgi:hypothetical protein
MEKFCDCSESWWKDHKLYKGLCAKGKGGGVMYSCFETRPQNPVVMANINGVRICGKRDGENFISFKRNIDLQVGGRCAEGFQPCGNTVGSPTNTWCIK